MALNKMNDVNMSNIKISGKSLGRNKACFIIAEAGVNHNGKIDLAKKLVDELKEILKD